MGARATNIKIILVGALLCLFLQPPANAALLTQQAGAATNTSQASQDLEGEVHGFPTLCDLEGRKLADGEFTQTLENGRLHVRITYQFGDGRKIEEQAIFQQQPRLVQERWSWREVKNGKVFREFEADFSSGKAIAQKQEGTRLKFWSEHLKIEPGRTFAGFGFSLALKELREPLMRGQKVELLAVAFSPKPRIVSVLVSYGGLDHVTMGGRGLKGDRFIIHPKLPWVAKAFISVPDTRIWLTTPPPASFLRWEGQLVEPSDPVIRVDRLSGGQSGPAGPISR